MKAIFELKERLDKENIDHEFIDRASPYTEFYQIVLKDENNYISVIQGYGSYGNEKNLLELYDPYNCDEPEGYLTVEGVLNIIKNTLGL